MALNQWRTNFEGNQRLDLPDFRSMMDRAYADFNYLIKSYIDNEAVPRVVKRYQEGAHSANTFKILKDANRAFHDHDQNWMYANSDTAGVTQSLTVPSNNTSYISVRLKTSKDDLQVRAFWDTDIGLTGEEFFDEINVRLRLDEEFDVNQTGFYASSSGWIPLFTVVTDSLGAITSVTRADDLLWRNRAFSLPSTRASVWESSVKDLRTFIDFLGAIIEEFKGTSQKLEDKPWSSFKLLREYQNIFYSGGGTVSWEIDTPETLRFTDKILLNIAGRSTTYEIGNTGNNDYVLADGDCLYVDIPETASVSISPVVAPLSSVPINPTTVGSNPRIMVLFFRKGSKIFGSMDLSELESGESDSIGQDLSNEQKARLGIISNTSYVPYSNSHVISPNDNYALAISKLDAKIKTIMDDTAKEYSETVSDNLGKTIFDIVGFTWVDDDAVLDIAVFVNGRKQTQSLTGSLDFDFRKTSDSQIEFSYNVPKDALVQVRKERSGGGTGIQVDLENIVVNPQPITNAYYSLGTSTKAWKSVFLKDKSNTDIYELEIVSGIFQATKI